MLSQPRQLRVMLQSYHPVLRSGPSMFVQRCEPTCMYSLILSCCTVPFRSSSSSCHLSSPLLALRDFFFPRMLWHHLVSMATQQEVHQASGITANPPLFLWLDNCLDEALNCHVSDVSWICATFYK